MVAQREGNPTKIAPENYGTRSSQLRSVMDAILDSEWNHGHSGHDVDHMGSDHHRLDLLRYRL